MIGPANFKPVAEEQDGAGQDRDDREADGEVGEAAHLAEELLGIAQPRAGPRRPPEELLSARHRDPTRIYSGVMYAAVMPAVDGERRAVDVGGLVGGEEERGLRDLVGLRQASRSGCAPCGARGGPDRREELLQERRIDGTGTEGVGADALARANSTAISRVIESTPPLLAV